MLQGRLLTSQRETLEPKLINAYDIKRLLITPWPTMHTSRAIHSRVNYTKPDCRRRGIKNLGSIHGTKAYKGITIHDCTFRTL